MTRLEKLYEILEIVQTCGNPLMEANILEEIKAEKDKKSSTSDD